MWTPSSSRAAVLPACVNHPQGEPSTTVVTGFPGQRLYISPKHPRECTEDGVNPCPGDAYLLTGDKVETSGTCDEWTLVRFSAGQRSTVGWVTSRRLDTPAALHINFGFVERLENAVDPHLCAAILKGEVEDVGLRDVTRYPILVEAGGLEYVPMGFAEVTAVGSVDLLNEGIRRPIALLSLDWSIREFEYHTEWPVVLGSNGLPDADVSLRGKLFEVAGRHNHVRVVRLQGGIYVENRPTSDAEDSKHEVWRYSTDGAVKVCTYTRVPQFAQVP